MKLHSVGLWTAENGMWLILTVVATFVAAAGERRHLALMLCAGTLLAYRPNWFEFGAAFMTLEREGLAGSVPREYLRTGILLGCAPIAVAMILLARRYRKHPLGRRPVLAQHVVFLLLLALALTQWLHGLPQVVLWAVIATFASYFSYLAYALIDQRRPKPESLTLQLACFNPLGFPTPVPMGKGAANWRSVEAQTEHELAVTQLSGLKLLVWALLLKGVLLGLRVLFYGYLGLPPLESAFDAFLRTGHVPAPQGLLSVLLNFPDILLSAAIWGHVFIALARLAGFRLLRNTWRPLSSRTVAEFWNRYMYYFKETLVHFYFYPTFLTCFKRHPRLRLAFATFMAAGVGNFFLHLIVDRGPLARYGLMEALTRMQTYAFYCVVLAAGITISQLRTRKPDAHAGWWRSRFVPALGVMAFYCLLSFFDGPMRHVSLREHFGFLFEVFRIDQWMQVI
jgi:hypothetical protein